MVWLPGVSQNLKQVPQNFKKTFDIGVTLTSQLMMSYMLIKKKVWANFTFCFSVFIAIINKQANILHCSIGSISRPTSLHDQAIAMDRY